MARILSVLSFNLVAVRRQGVNQLADLTGDLQHLRITTQFLELPSELGVEVNLSHAYSIALTTYASHHML